MATAELYKSSHTLFQESFKPPVYVLNVSICSDQKFLCFSVFKIGTADSCWLRTGSSTQRFYISNQQVG